jgi:2,4-dienoyl-CoA reductase-like NADH-dependent reductase (Old Yellow Enzyme family)
MSQHQPSVQQGLLFQPFTLKGLRLVNRLVRSATFEKRADDGGGVTDALITLYERLASGGAGLLITGAAAVHPSGRFAPRMLQVHDDRCLSGLEELAAAVHGRDGLVCLQLAHGGRQCRPEHLGGAEPIAPSAVHDPTLRVTPRPMAEREIWELVDAFGEAARRALRAGFDAIQIHAAHGYLLSGFLSPHTNRREDAWGGDEARRFRFVEEVIRSVRRVVGTAFPLLIKLNGSDGLDGGLSLGEAVRIGQRLEALGVDAVEVSGGMYESGRATSRPGILSEDREAYHREAGRAFKRALTIPVLLVGGFRSRAIMEGALADGSADLISVGRPLLREPDLPRRLHAGKERADCISCNGCLRADRLDVVECVRDRPRA